MSRDTSFYGGAKRRRIKEQKILEQENRCWWCDRECTDGPQANLWRSPTFDHLHSVAGGGPDEAQNAVMACKECNTARGHSGFRNTQIINCVTKKEFYVYSILLNQTKEGLPISCFTAPNKPPLGKKILSHLQQFLSTVQFLKS